MEFRLPDIGEGVAEGEIVKWLVSEGQKVKEDQPLVQVMTDKVTVEIPSPTTGTVSKIVATEGRTVKVGEVIVVLSKDGEVAISPPQQQMTAGEERPTTKTPTQKPEQQAEEVPKQSVEIEQRSPAFISPRVEKVVATPATRKLARELGVDLASVRGTGPGGRITEDDVRKTSQRKIAPMAAAQKLEVPATRTAEAPKISGKPETVSVPSFLGIEERIPLRGIRKLVAERMARSKHIVADVTHVDEVDMSQVVALREVSKSKAEARGIHLTYLPFIIKSVVAALKEFPYLNASIDDEKQEIVLKKYYNIGIATDVEPGLVVPVLKEADKKNIFEIARELERLAQRARNNQLALEEVQGGTFTITNVGSFGGVFSTPIVNWPEVAILGVAKIGKRPAVRDGQVVARDITYLALTFDHRVTDGAYAARFTTRVKEYLEDPKLLLLEIE
jgi:2-oxoglutarate dehydrogenase complex dihydrolipoamide succinyltransferase (E2) component